MKASPKFLALTLITWGLLVQSTSAQVTIDSTQVYNLSGGNANDSTGFGAVNYNYSIGKYEVTLNQYAAFLNAVAATDTYSLYNANMAANANIAGIIQGGVSGSFTYSVTGTGDRPVTYVSWFDAARFVNWLQNGQPTGLQVVGTTETGTYALNGATSGLGFTRAGTGIYSLPSENEWYKAAYYDLSLNSGSGGYWLYPTRSNTQPNSRNGSGSDPNSANFRYDDSIANGFNGGYAVNNSPLVPAGNALTDAGAFSLASSYYGTYDQGGNVWEWNDAVVSGTSRVFRGGSWDQLTSTLASSFRNQTGPGAQVGNLGFRVIVPEPSAVGLMSLGFAALVLVWKRRRIH